jgi:hypothetical protein
MNTSNQPTNRCPPLHIRCFGDKIGLGCFFGTEISTMKKERVAARQVLIPKGRFPNPWSTKVKTEKQLKRLTQSIAILLRQQQQKRSQQLNRKRGPSHALKQEFGQRLQPDPERGSKLVILQYITQSRSIQPCVPFLRSTENQYMTQGSNLNPQAPQLLNRSTSS